MKSIILFIILVVPALCMSQVDFNDVYVVYFVLEGGFTDMSSDAQGVYALDTSKSIYRVTGLSRAVDVRNIRQRTSSVYSGTGPWAAKFIEIIDAEAAVDTLQSDPNVSSAWLRDGQSGDIVASTATYGVLPPSSKDLFCDQELLHHKRTAADLLEGEQCSIFVDYDGYEHDMDLPQAWAITKGVQ